MREQLWFKPLLFSLLSVAAAFVADIADRTGWGEKAPAISPETNQTLLEIMAASMLVIATFAVASMVSAYASASNTATPRSFPLIVSDDTSQNALSAFVGAFIFSIVSITASHNGYYGPGGQFVLFVLTLVVFAVVILTFVRWVDKIARLGRLGNTIEKVESATANALRLRRLKPTLGGARLTGDMRARGEPIVTERIGYVLNLDVAALESCAEEWNCRIYVASLPGSFAAPGRALAFVEVNDPQKKPIDEARVREAFLIGSSRVYDEDPRFGIIVLSEIAARALSPAVNDPGTAIGILGSLVRLLAGWVAPEGEAEKKPDCERVFVPELATPDLFDDAFTAIARDGAGLVEVAVRLQKALASLAASGNGELIEAARVHSGRALERARAALHFDDEVEKVEAAAKLIEN